MPRRNLTEKTLYAMGEEITITNWYYDVSADIYYGTCVDTAKAVKVFGWLVVEEEVYA